MTISRVTPEHLAHTPTLDALAALHSLRALALPCCGLRTLQQLRQLCALTSLTSLDVVDNALQHLTLLPSFVRHTLPGVRVLNGVPLERTPDAAATGSLPDSPHALHTWGAVAAHVARVRDAPLAQIIRRSARRPSGGAPSPGGTSARATQPGGARGASGVVVTGWRGDGGSEAACKPALAAARVAETAEGLMSGAMAAAARLDDLDGCWAAVVGGLLAGDAGGGADLDGF